MSADNTVCIGFHDGQFKVADNCSTWWGFCDSDPDDPGYIEFVNWLFADAPGFDSIDEAIDEAYRVIGEIESFGGYVEYGYTILPCAVRAEAELR